MADISMYGRNPLRSVADYQMDYQKVDDNNQTLQANALKLQEARRGAAEAMQIRNALASLGGGATDDQRIAALKGTGLASGFTAADALEKAAVEKRKGLATAAKTEQEAESEKIKKRVAAMNEVFSGLQRAPTLEAAQEVLGAGFQSGGIGSFKAASAMAKQVEDAWGDPTKRTELLDKFSMSLVEQTKRFEQEQQNKRNAATNATSIATNAATNLTSRANNTATVAEQARGHTLQNDRALASHEEAKKTPKLTTIEDPQNPGSMIVVDANTYQSPSGTPSGVIGGAGKTSKRTAEMADAVGSLKSAHAVLDDLTANYDVLEKSNSIVSDKRGVFGNVTTGIGTTDIGQGAQRLLGTKAQTARNNIEGSRNLLLTSIKAAAGLTAREMDTNADVKRWMSTVTDPKSSLESNRAAIQKLRDFIDTRSSSKVNGGAPPAAARPPLDAFDKP
jgi:hypothetical protein